MEFLTNQVKESFIITIYGPPGVGKSTLASKAPGAVFLDVENGVARYGFKRTPVPKSVDEFKNFMRELFKSDDCKTIVIDTLGAVQKLFVKQLIDSTGGQAESISDSRYFGYGAGVKAMQKLFYDFVEICQSFKQAGKNVILIGHDQNVMLENPDGEDYKIHGLDIEKRCIDIVTQNVDAVFFAHKETVWRNVSKGSNKKIASETGAYLLQGHSTPTVIAKNRFGITDFLEYTNEEQVKQFYMRLSE